MSEPHERLSQAMNTRRLELDMKWNAVATEAGISPEALRAIRRGDYKPSPLTARRLDDALQWPAGTVLAFYDPQGPGTAGQAPATGAAPPGPPADDTADPTALAVRQMARHLEAMEARLTELTEEVARLRGERQP